MKAFIFSSALLAVAAGNTCDDCTAVVSTLATLLVADESIMAQQVCAVTWVVGFLKIQMFQFGFIII